MMHYENINYVLANYFNCAHGLTEQEGVDALRQHLIANPAFKTALREELEWALSEGTYSLCESFDAHEVASIADEKEARQYAETLLGFVLTNLRE